MEDFKAARWGTPPSDLSLGVDEVHVWRAKVGIHAAEMEQLVGELPWRERQAAKRADQPKQFVAVRHMVRTLMGRYLGREPGKVKLGRGDAGKLTVSEDGGPRLHLAISQGRALLAVSGTQTVAVAIDAVPEREEEIAARMSAVPPREARQLEFLSPDNRAQMVVGYEVEQAALNRLASAGGVPSSRVERLKVGGGYVAALAADGWEWSPSFWRYLRPSERPEDDGDEPDDGEEP